jgi:hypothetical protein
LAIGADGPRESAAATLDGIEVGGVRFDGVPIAATADLASKAPANVGLDLLRHFRLTIDFGGDRLWLTPRPEVADVPFLKNRSGLSLTPEGDHLRVAHVAAGSPAEAGGWQVGQTIVAVDGQAITPAYAASPLSRWGFGPPGKLVALTLPDGRRKALKLADYY